MPPQGKKFPAGSGKKQAAHSREAKKQKDGADHPNLQSRPRDCDTCGQNTHGFDRHCPPGTYLYWPKAEVCATTKIKTPMGTECGHCLYVRQKYYAKGTTAQQIIQKKKDPAENARHERLREDRASGRNECQMTDAVNAQLQTVQERKDFSEAFVEGELCELRGFCRDRNLQFSSQEEAVKYINERLGFETGMGETNEFGVFVVEKRPGARCKFRKGLARSSGIIREEGHDDLQSAVDQGLEDSADMRSKEGFHDVTSAAEHDAEEGTLSTDNGIAPMLAPPPQASRGGSQSQCQSQDLSILPSSASGAGSARSEAGGNFDVQSISSGEGASRKRPFSMTASAFGESASEAPGSPRSGHGTPMPPARNAKDAKDAPSSRKTQRGASRDVGGTTWTVANLWNKRYRQRDFENLLTRLTAKANKVGSSMVDESAEVSDQLFRTGVRLEETRDCFEKLKRSPEVAISTEVPKVLVNVLKQADVPLQSNMASTICCALLGQTDPASHALALKMAKYHSGDSSSHLSVATFGSIGIGDDDEFLANCQHNLIQSFVDKALKRISKGEFSALMAACDGIIGECDINALNIDSAKIDPSTGWLPLVMADLNAVRFFGKVLAVDAKEKLPRDLRVEALRVHANKEKLSNRLRCLIRVGAGSTNWARAAWERTPFAEFAGTSEGVALDSTVQQMMITICAEIKTFTSGDNGASVEKLFEIVSRTVMDTGGRLKDIDTFAKCMDSLDDEKASQEASTLISLKNELLAALGNAMTEILAYYDRFSDNLENVYAVSACCAGDTSGMASDADCFRLFSGIAKIILKFEIGVPERAVVQEAKLRAELVVDANETKM
ncbi:unnamed protein product, partial [Prorocentrum cordatum]